MNNPLNKLHQEAKALSLSTHEKVVMHATIMERVHASTGAQKEASAPRQLPGLFYFSNPQFAMSFVALLVVVLGGGTVFAAQGSLPGDPLYALKTEVSEPIQGALVFSVESKIDYHASLVQTRLEEAEVLASQNRLDSSTSAQIEANLDTHLAERQALVGKLEEQRPGTTFASSAKYDTQITAHGDVLVQLGLESSSSTTRENSNTIAMRVRTSGNSYGYNARGANTMAMAKRATPTAPAPTVMTLSVAAQENSSSTEDTHLEIESQSTGKKKVGKSHSKEDTQSAEESAQMKSAIKLGAKATSSLEALRGSAAKLKDIDDKTQTRLDSRFTKIEALIAEGKAAVETHDYDDAKDSFNEALERSVTLSTFISANVKFNNGILGNLLGNDSRWGSDEGE